MPPSPETDFAECISPMELSFERWRKSLGLVLGPAAGLLVLWLPMPSLAPQAHLLAAVLAGVATWWITEPVPLPVTALVGAALCVLLGIADARRVFAPFADPIIMLFLGGLMLAEAMAVHRLDKRFAYAIMSLPWVGSRTGRLLCVYGGVCALLSMWISNTAATAMMLPIGLGIVTAVGGIRAEEGGGLRGGRFGTGMMLMAAYAASAGGIGTPVGTPPNLIGIAMIEKYCHVRISFFQWMSFAVPLLVLLFGLLFALMYLLHKPEAAAVGGGGAFLARERERLGPWTRGQKNALVAFLVTVALWVLPGLLALFLGAEAPLCRVYNARVPEGVAALGGAALLFLLPVDWKAREFTLSWSQAVRIDWGTLLLFGGGMTLGTLMFDLRLAEALGRGLLSCSGATSVWGITFGAIFIAILVSETSSNTASANMVVPVMIALAQAAGVNPVPAAIGATLGASWGFMLPVSTPPNAIVYGSGLVPITRMIRAGVCFDVLGGLVIWAGLRILLPWAGLA